MKISTFLIGQIAVLTTGFFIGPEAFDIVRLLFASIWAGGLGYVTFRYVLSGKARKSES